MSWLQSRAWVGPKYEQSNSAYFYDWSAHNLGDELSALAGAVLTLPSTISATATSVGVTRPSGLTIPSKGGVWIAGNGSGQAWEYVQYSGLTVVNATSVTLTGCLREPETNREHNGAHNSGAAIRFWWPLDTMAGEFGITHTMDDAECATDWTAEASGWIFPQAALRDGHLFVYQTRTTAGAAFTNRLIGFIDERNSEHDYRRHGKWAVKIVSSSGMINRYRATGVRRGKYNIARGAGIEGSPALGAAWKERASGDFIAAEPQLAASSATDGDKKTLYIADRYIGTEPDHYQFSKESTPQDDRLSLLDPSIRTNTDAFGKHTMHAGALIISEIHLALTTGQESGQRYVELTCLDTQAADSALVHIYLATDNAAVWYGLTLGAMATGDTVIICENEGKFREENPAAQPSQLIDLSETAYYNFLKNLSLSGDTLALFYEYTAITPVFMHEVTWGSGGAATITPPSNINWDSDLSFGTALAVATAGQTYYYNYARSSTAASNWTVSLLHTPGYDLGDAPVWLKLELPPLGLKLAQDITSGYTGAVRITDDTEDTTAGLDTDGEMQIGGERILYNTRTATTVNLATRGYGGTTAAAHIEGDAVFPYEDGVAKNCWPIRALELVRDGSIIISNYSILATYSSYAPRTPGDNIYATDYEFSASVTGNTDEVEIYNFATTHRLRHILLFFNAMSSAPARPRINEIRALPDESYFDSSVWLSGGETAAELARQILLNVKVPSGAITIESTGGSGEHATANTLAWDVVTSYAAYAGLRVDVGLDSKINIRINDYLTASVFTASYTWTKDNSTQIKAVHAPPSPVGQVKVKWQDNDGVESGTAVFPASSSVIGEILEMDEQVYSDGDQAAVRAEKVYWRNRFPYSWIIEALDDGILTQPGEIHYLTDWQLNSEMGQLTRTCLVKGVDHLIEQSQETHTLSWRSVVHLVEIERTEAA